MKYRSGSSRTCTADFWAACTNARLTWWFHANTGDARHKHVKLVRWQTKIVDSVQGYVNIFWGHRCISINAGIPCYNIHIVHIKILLILSIFGTGCQHLAISNFQIFVDNKRYIILQNYWLLTASNQTLLQSQHTKFLKIFLAHWKTILWPFHEILSVQMP